MPQERTMATRLIFRRSVWLFILWMAIIQPATAMEFTTAKQSAGLVLLAQGEIKVDDSRKLRALLARSKISGATVYLDSPGGPVGESFKIGILIRDHRLGTVVPKGAECASACVFVFAGGVVREVQPGGKVGVHMASMMFDDEYVNALEKLLLTRSTLSVHDRVRVIVAYNEQFAATVMAATANYLVRMGLSMKILFPTVETSHLDIHWLTANELRDYNVVNTD